MKYPLMNNPGILTVMGPSGKRVLKKQVKDILGCWTCTIVVGILFELVYHYFTNQSLFFR